MVDASRVQPALVQVAQIALHGRAERLRQPLLGRVVGRRLQSRLGHLPAQCIDTVVFGDQPMAGRLGQQFHRLPGLGPGPARVEPQRRLGRPGASHGEPQRERQAAQEMQECGQSGHAVKRRGGASNVGHTV
ncbi:hypothetical protein FQZ97_1196130 [compost metagenome]